jgi:hypothetical protein
MKEFSDESQKKYKDIEYKGSLLFVDHPIPGISFTAHSGLHMGGGCSDIGVHTGRKNIIGRCASGNTLWRTIDIRIDLGSDRTKAELASAHR